MPRDRPALVQGFAPNRFFKDSEAIFLVVVRSARYGTFALNKASIDYIVSKGEGGFVALVETDFTPVAVMPVEEVAERVVDAPTLHGNLGPYYWLDKTGGPADGFRSYAAPF